MPDENTAEETGPHRRGGEVRPPRLFLRWAVLGFFGMFLMTSAWSMANPINAAPDEAGHAITAYATVHGQVGTTTPMVPAVFADLAERDLLMCHHSSWNEGASCQDWKASAEKPARATFSQFGTYNPLYYALVGWPTLILDPHAALYGVRLVSAFLCSVLFGLALGVAAFSYKTRSAATGVIVALSPMVVFLGGTINPNAVEIFASLLCWVALTALFSRDLRDFHQRVVISVATVGLVALILTRLLSPLWAVAIVVLTATVSVGWSRLWNLVRSSRYFQGHLAAVVASGLIATWWSLTNPAVFVGGVNNKADSVRQLIELSMNQIFTVFPSRTLMQTFGILGWTEFPLPAVVPIMTAVWGGVILVAFAVSGKRAERYGMLGLLAFSIGFPAVLSSYMWSGVGWQGRYALPLTLGIPILGCYLLALRLSSTHAGTNMVRIWTRTAVVAVLACNLYAFVVNYPRYSAGWGRRWHLSEYTWQPPLGFAIWLIAFLAGLVLLAYATWRSSAGRERGMDGSIGTERGVLGEQQRS